MSDLRVAVLSMTRDRLLYSQTCFQTLRENAGISYSHFVLDQGSTDGTVEWLLAQDDLDVTTLSENIGICKGLNLLLDEAVNLAEFDLICRVDNDAEVLQPYTLRVVAELAYAHNVILAPRILGLLSPPPTLSTFVLDGHTVAETQILGGVFCAIPSRLFTDWGYRYNERFPPYTGDEDICRWWRAQGGRCGYVESLQVNHYGAAVNEENDFPLYLERKKAEMAAA